MESNGGIEVPLPAISEGATVHVDKESISQAVKVAVHIRPLIGPERLQGCKDCITVVPGEPQVQIGNHTFTFDHVYGSTGSPSAAIFEECVEPLVEGLFHGYNATVLAYGQTGSGKTYTMGTAYTVGGSTDGVIPQVMEMIFKKAESLQDTTEFQLRVSFIEILKEEVHDLLDPNPPTSVKPEMLIGFGLKPTGPVKPPIQIRETSNGGITLAGVTETDVRRLEEMAACLEQGSLCRATASTNMNSRSSRSHAIFTITLEQKRKWDLLSNGDSPLLEETSEDFLCAKLHLVDLAGSERAKRTGADGLRFKEGVHINKGLLALGNVISALGDDKKRKEGGHVPYRDSKLTRLLQDSLGGNSRTVMIACVSPADSNAEETLNTLKYANRARNIQNKPIVNRDPMAAEMQRMRQQLDLLQAELLYMREGPGSSDDTQMLKQKNGWLEATISDLRQELEESRQRALDAQVERDKLHLKLESLRSGKSLDELDNGSEAQGVGMLQTYAVRIQELESEMRQLRDSNSQDFVASKTYATLPCTNDSIVATGNYAELPEGIEAVEAEETAAKELEHTIRQDFMDKELQELNKKLEQKEAEMKTFSKYDGVILKQHFEKKIVELEEEKVALQRERDCLLAEVEKLASVSDDQTQKMQEAYMQKLKALESQIAELKNKQENQAQLLKQKQRSDEAAKRLQDEIQRIKTQKVQLQHKIKQESEQFRFWKASREKEVLQLKKEGRRNEYEMHKLQALHQRQKMVLQRKTEEAALATRRLKELLEARKPSPRDLSLTGSASTNRPSGQMNEKSIQQLLDHELEVAVHIHGVRSNYEKQTHSRAALAKELAQLKQEEDMKQKSSTGIISVSMSPGARSARIRLLESMLNASSSTLVAMASQLSEAEEQERAFSGRGRWQHLRTMGDAKNLLQYIFDTTTYARCQLWDNALEIKELKEKITELTDQLRQSEAYKKDIDRKQYLRDQAVARPLSTGKVNLDGAVVKRGAEDLSISVSQSDGLGLCQPQYLDSCPGFSSGGMPYDLRKAPRGYSYAHHDDMESTDGDIDMDIDDDGDQSDEDWNEEGERRVMKTRGGGEQRGRVSRTGIRAPLSVDSNPGCGSALDQHGHECLGHPSGEGENGNRETQSNPEKERCCSCSQSSSCKTKKCECKAAGDLCGPSCRCKASKCANREIVNGEAELSLASSANQAEVAEAMATLKLDRANRWNYGKGDAIQSDRFTGDDVVGVDEVKHAEEVLARHGVALLENVWKDEKIENSHSHLDMKGDESGIQEKGNQRRPLTDIGNTKVSAQLEGHPTVKQRKRWQKKVLVQIVPVAPHTNAFDPVTAYQPDLARSESASEIAVPSSTETAVIGAIDTNVVTSVRAPTNNSEAHSTAMDRVASLSVKLPMNGRKKSSQSSPLRARNMHNAEDAGVSKKLGNGPASPRGSGRGTEEKENV